MLTGTQIAIIVVVIIVVLIIIGLLIWWGRDVVATGMAPNMTVTYKQTTPHRQIPEANRINLFVEYYLSKDPERQKEIDFTLRTNLAEKNIDHVYVIVHSHEEEKKARTMTNRRIVSVGKGKERESEGSGDEYKSDEPVGSLLDEESKPLNVPRGRSTSFDGGPRSRVRGRRVPDNRAVSFIRIKNPRPTYGEIFRLIDRYNGDDDVNIFCNSDIAFDASIGLVRRLHPDEAVALTRWNVDKYSLPLNGRLENDPKWTQDTWIIRGPVDPALFNVSFGTGLLRCDNRIAYILSEEIGYKVFNPCHTLKSFHVHKSNIRNYTPVNVGKIHPSDYPKHNIVEGNGSYILPSVWL